MEDERRFFADLDLSRTLLICVQHLCSTTYALFKAFFNLNLDPHHLFVLGKCYSTDPKVYSQLKDESVNISKASLHFNSHAPYDTDFEHSCYELLQQVVSTKNLNMFEKIIILDDGGHLIEKASVILPKHLNVVGVEQTSSGYNRLKDEEIFFPIVNLARSWLKLEYESPIIVQLMQRKLCDKLSSLFIKTKKVLLIGYGSIGQQAYQYLKNSFDVTAYDLDQKKSMIKLSDFKNRLNEFDIVIGCTGATSLTFENFKYLKNPVILASISSSDREFEAVRFRKLHGQFQNCHVDLSKSGITLLNSGFPITFDDDFDGIDIDDFQLTRALIFTALCQAFSMESKITGFVEMRDDYQKRILKNFQHITFK